MKQPELDSDGYPTEGTLAAIATWPIKSNKDILDLFEFLDLSWTYPFLNGFSEDKEGTWIRLATGSWSSNESLVGALEENRMFWGLCWLESQRGGSYKFLTQPFKEKL